MSVNAFDMQRMLQSIPEINEQRRKAQMLRGISDTFQNMSRRPTGGNYTPTQQGGLYQTVAKYHKDYGKIGNDLAGALGTYLGTRAGNAERDLANQTGSAQIEAAQTMGGGTMTDAPTAQALRAYMGLVGGADAKGIMGSIPRVQSTKTDKDGKIWNVMSDGSTQDTGLIADYKTNTIKTADGRVVNVGTSGAGRSIAEQVQEVTGTPMSQISVEGQEPIRVESSMPDNQVAAIIRQTMGLPENAPIPEYTSTPAAPAQTAQPLRIPTAAEEAAAAAQGKAQGEAAVAPLIAQTAGAVDLAKNQAKTTAEAQAGLGAVETTVGAGIKAIDRLMNNPGLDNIVGGGLWGRLPDKIAELGVDAFEAGTPAATAMADYKNITGANFLQAFQQLKGGGQITEIEGAKAEAALARLRRSQSKEEFQKALGELRTVMEQVLSNARNKAKGGAAPAATDRPALPVGFEWGE